MAAVALLICVVSGWQAWGRGTPVAVASPSSALAGLDTGLLEPWTPPPEGADRPKALETLRSGQVASRSLNLLKLRYVDPGKFAPRQMLTEALQYAAHLVPEMLVDAPQVDADGMPLQLRVRIGEATRTFPLDRLEGLYQAGWYLLESLRFVADHLPPDVPAAKIEYQAINGLLSTLDPYSRMLDPDSWREMQTSTGGNFGGLGIVILPIDGVLTVQSVLPDSPARKAGLQPGDQIHQIDGEDTVNMSVDAAVERLRGEVGTTARLMIRRKGWDKSQAVAVVRAVIHLQSVESRVLDNGVGYARIKNFQRGTASELGEAVDQLLASGARQALVLDLRDNPGGLLDEAIRVCDLFIPDGPAVITVSGGQRQRDVRLVTGNGRFSRMALAVLLSGRSASASEVVAGALKHSGRAIVLGEQSFGKGSVQVPFEIGDAALKLTVARYLVPGDISIHGVGITPDIGIQFVSATREQVNLFASPRKRAASKGLSEAPPPPPVQLKVLLPDATPTDKSDVAVVETPAEVMDREPRERAAALLRRAGHPSAKAILAEAQRDLQEMARTDDQALVQHLRRQGIDWRPGANEGTPALRLQIADGKDGLHAAAGDVLRMSATLTNTGDVPLHRLHVLTVCDDWALDGHEQLVGRLEPGQSRTVHLSVRVSVRHTDLQVPLQMVAAQDGKRLPVADRTLLTVKGRETPEFSFRVRLDDGPAGDGVLQPGEQGRFQIEVRNDGKGLAPATVVRLRSVTGQRLHLGEGRARLGAVAVGATAEATLAVRGTDTVGGKGPKAGDWEPARIELTLVDETLGVERTQLVEVPWGRRPVGDAPPPARLALERVRATAERWDVAPRIEVQGQGTPEEVGLRPLQAECTGAPIVDGRQAVGRCHCTLPLQGTVGFGPDQPPRRFVTASVGGIKQFYQAGHGMAEVPFAARLRLDPGLQAVTVQAQAGPQRTAERGLLVHCGVP